MTDNALQPGINEVTISGLSPTLDEDSVKVEGTGAAVITDIAVAQLPNRDIFEEVYPEEDDDDADDETDDEETGAKDSTPLQEAKDRLIEVKDRLSRASETVASATKRLAILDTFSKPFTDKHRPDVGELLENYKTEREKAFEDHIVGAAEQRKIQREVDDATETVSRLERLESKARQKERKEKEREQLKRRRRREERAKERWRVRKEREQFWPKYCYSVTITLDVNSMTPMSSRRQSISSDVDVFKPASAESGVDDDATITERVGCDLVLSYVTTSASWTPSYDLQLSTTNGTGTLCFDAQLRNTTSETWAHCKISLSTSDTTFAGLDSRIPILVPWRIRLANKANQAFGSDGANISHSNAEIEQQKKYFAERKNRATVQKPRYQMFGIANRDVVEHSAPPGLFGAEQSNDKSPNRQANQAPRAGGLFGSSTTDARRHRSSLFASSESAPPHPPPPPAPAAAPVTTTEDTKAAFADHIARRGVADTGFVPEAVDFEDSVIEESGLTTNYDLPGLKTLAPRNGASKQRVARVTFSNVSLSHTVVAKYRPVAYLKAKLKNNSKLTLLEGNAGLTLDGSFMGRTHIPRCSSGDMFTLSLGVDPAIKVSYPKPEVRRATTGLFTKENSSVFARAVILQNTRAAAGKPAQLLVLDQVPVSEDERLRVDLVTPSGLSVSGGSVATGAPGREVDRDREWGKAVATLKKGGEVNWDVKLNAGKVVKLWLEYSVSMPSSDTATECFSG